MRISALVPLVLAGAGIVLVAAPSGAQIANQPPLSNGYTSELPQVSDTPSGRKLKLAQAMALRAEAADLQAADGGTLSPRHVAYIRDRAHVILYGNSPQTGSLIRRR